MSKTAIVFGGGGAKGSYQIGVLKALNELKIKYDIITGCSVGSINGAITAQGELDLARKLWKNLSTDKVLDLKDNNLNPDLKGVIENNGYEYTNLKKLLNHYIDEDKIRNSLIDFGLVTVKYPDMTPVYLFLEDIEKGKLVDYILGSSAFFPAMRPYKIDDSLYIDGGFYDNLPINMAIDKGATKIIAIDLKAIGVIKKPKSKDVKITRISSYLDLGKVLEFNSNKAKANMKLGYNDAMKAFSKLDGFKYTFYKNEISDNYKKNIKAYNLFFDTLFKKMPAPLKANFFKSLNIVFSNEIKTIKKPTINSYSTFILENIMELLNMPYFEAYKLKKVNFLIKKKLKACDISDLYELRETLNNFNLKGNVFDILKRINNAIENFDKIKFIKYLSENIDCFLKENPKLLVFLGICAPKEFFSAIYIRFI